MYPNHVFTYKNTENIVQEDTILLNAPKQFDAHLASENPKYKKYREFVDVLLK